MKNFLIALFFSLSLLYCSSWQSEINKTARLRQQCEDYEQTLKLNSQKEKLVFKHAVCLPDSFLREYFPDAKNLDSLKSEMVEDYGSCRDF